jgi:hypothetical protein
MQVVHLVLKVMHLVLKVMHRPCSREYERSRQRKVTALRDESSKHVDSGGMRMMNNVLWIPERAVELQLPLCEEAHCRSEKHRVFEATLGATKECYVWTKMAKDIKVFVQNYLHRVATTSEDKVPRQLDTRLHATKRNEILHFDSCTFDCH